MRERLNVDRFYPLVYCKCEKVVLRWVVHVIVRCRKILAFTFSPKRTRKPEIEEVGLGQEERQSSRESLISIYILFLCCEASCDLQH